MTVAVTCTLIQESLELGCLTACCALCRKANTATAEMAVLKWLALSLLLSAGPKLAAARGLLEAVPANLLSARALLQAEQCTCTCPSQTAGPAPAPAPQPVSGAAPALAPETGSPPAPALPPLPENTSTLAPAPEIGSPPAEALGPDMGGSTVPAPAPESGSPGASAPALVPGSSISETPVPITAGSPHDEVVLVAQHGSCTAFLLGLRSRSKKQRHTMLYATTATTTSAMLLSCSKAQTPASALEPKFTPDLEELSKGFGAR